MSMTHQQLMAMTKEQLVQAYKELESLYAKLQQAQSNSIADFNSRASSIEHDFAVAKRKLTNEIATLKAELAQKNAELVKKDAELVKAVAALKAKN